MTFVRWQRFFFVTNRQKGNMKNNNNILKGQQNSKTEYWVVARTSREDRLGSLNTQRLLCRVYLERFSDVVIKGVFAFQGTAYANKDSDLEKFLQGKISRPDVQDVNDLDNIPEGTEHFFLPKQANVLLLRADRLCRNSQRFYHLNKIIKERDLSISFVEGDYVWDKHTDRFIQNRILHAVVDAEYESAKNSKRVSESHETARMLGETYSRLPVGYSRDPIKKEVIIDEEKGPIITKLFELYATGKWSAPRLAQEAFKMGLYTTDSKTKEIKALSMQSMLEILKRPFYCGYIVHKKEFEEKSPITGKMRKIRKEVSRQPHKYPTLVSFDMFERCQNIIKGRSTKLIAKERKDGAKYLFRGMIRDKHCLKLFSPYTQKGNGYLKNPVKGQKDLAEKIFYKSTLAVLDKVSANNEVCHLINKQFNAEVFQDLGTLNRDLEILTATKNQLISGLSKLYDDEGGMPEAIFNNIKAQKLAEIDRKEKEIAATQASIDAIEKRLPALSGGLRQMFQNMNLDEQIKFIQIVFDKILYSEGRMEFILTEDVQKIMNKTSYFMQY